MSRRFRQRNMSWLNCHSILFWCIIPGQERRNMAKWFTLALPSCKVSVLLRAMDPLLQAPVVIQLIDAVFKRHGVGCMLEWVESDLILNEKTVNIQVMLSGKEASCVSAVELRRQHILSTGARG